MRSHRPLAAIVLAAGRSTRFRSATSKLLHPLAGRPILQWVLTALRELGANPIVAVVSPEAERIKALCGPRIIFATQAAPRGTGHAVLAAAPALADFTGDVLVLNGDLPLVRTDTLRRLVDAHRAGGHPLTLATADVDNPFGWGRIVRRAGTIRAIVEERDAAPEIRAVHEVNVGLYCAAAGHLFRSLSGLTPDNAQGELYLTDVVRQTVEAGTPIGDLRIDAVEAAQINSRRELAMLEKTVRQRINERWMDAGVTIEDPDTAYIGPDVTIGADTVIGPNVHLRGRTVVGAHCRLDGTILITDATLGDHVHVKFGVVIAQADIGPECMIGPFAQLRPGTHLGAGVHIGNFVETKNARLGRHAKANHLAYLGDTDIGTETNIGAGTITCNYDGFRKHRTVIGDRVQIGSDSQLVAPVTVADDAYVATGTTVRQDVPAGSLAFNEKRDIHRPGWVAARRAREAGGAVPAPTVKPAAPRRTRTAKTARKTAPAKTRATAAPKRRRRRG